MRSEESKKTGRHNCCCLDLLLHLGNTHVYVYFRVSMSLFVFFSKIMGIDRKVSTYLAQVHFLVRGGLPPTPLFLQAWPEIQDCNVWS